MAPSTHSMHMLWRRRNGERENSFGMVISSLAVAGGGKVSTDNQKASAADVEDSPAIKRLLALMDTEEEEEEEEEDEETDAREGRALAAVPREGGTARRRTGVAAAATRPVGLLAAYLCAAHFALAHQLHLVQLLQLRRQSLRAWRRTFRRSW